MTDFFISYTGVDKGWAEWIGYVLEDEGYSVIIQAWDFRPGNNFVLEMQDAATKASRTLMVLSPDYLQSQFASPEWAAAFGQDPQGRNMKLVPVMIRPCQPTGLLTSIVQIRVTGMDEAAARQALLEGISQKRAKPSAKPLFPGEAVQAQHKDFPGSMPVSTTGSTGGRSATPRLIPSLKRAPTDADKRRFAKQGFETIRALFETNLRSVAEKEDRIETEFQLTTATDFRAELFLDGKSKCVCRVWMGGMHSDNNISYFEGRGGSNSACNEILALPQAGELHFEALMASGGFRHETAFNMKNLSADEAAEYLWRRFVSPLER